MKTCTALAALVLVSMTCSPLAASSDRCAEKAGSPGSFELTLESGGWARSYRLHVPPQYDSAITTPLVVAIHGWGDNAANFETYTGLSDEADRESFIVAYPDGIDNSWNAGSCCGTAKYLDIDDVGFIRDLVAAVSESYCIASGRVYATGFSNGGLMSHRLACEAADLFAAVAPASGFIAVWDCDPPRPVPVIQTQGTADISVPYRTAKKSNDFWAEHNECGPASTVYQKGAATCIAYSDCADNATVEFCEVKGMGHMWPTYESTKGWIDANEMFWDFFTEHPLEE